MINTGRSTSVRCMFWLREIFWVAVLFNIHLVASYIRSEHTGFLIIFRAFITLRDLALPLMSYSVSSVVSGMEHLREMLTVYQSRWMADSTVLVRKSQWKMYMKFCEEFDRIPLAACVDTILLYLSFLASKLKYVSIINYVLAVWLLHKLNGFDHVDPSSFEIIGDAEVKARPATVKPIFH